MKLDLFRIDQRLIFRMNAVLQDIQRRWGINNFQFTWHLLAFATVLSILRAGVLHEFVPVFYQGIFVLVAAMALYRVRTYHWDGTVNLAVLRFYPVRVVIVLFLAPIWFLASLDVSDISSMDLKFWFCAIFLDVYTLAWFTMSCSPLPQAANEEDYRE